MNKSSKAILSLLMLLSAKAYSKNSLVSRDLLKENNLDPIVLEQLLKDKILLPSDCPEFFILNEKKVDNVLHKSKDQELKDFLIWLKSISGDQTEILEKNRDEMLPASQDIRA